MARTDAFADRLWRTDLDPAGGVVWLNVDRLFPADASGRVKTLRPDETIMIGDIDRYLPAS